MALSCNLEKHPPKSHVVSSSGRGVREGLPVAAVNFGRKLQSLGAGQHISCGSTGEGAAILWGAGDFVEGPAYPARRVECVDEAIFVVDGAGVVRIADYSSRNHLVYGDAFRATKDVAFVPAKGRSDRWFLSKDGSTSSSLSDSRDLGRKFTQIAGGAAGACGIEVNGQMYCENVAPLEGSFSQVSVGGAHVCALNAKGQAQCGGANSHGQSQSPTGEFMQISAGGLHTCALTMSGKIACWGAGRRSDGCHEPEWDCGQSKAPEGLFTAVRAGGYHTCALARDGRVACWGRNERGQAQAPQEDEYAESPLRCGLAPTRTEGLFDLVCWEQKGDAVVGKPFSPNVSTMAGHTRHLCVLLDDGRAACMRAPEENTLVPAFRVPDARFATLNVADTSACGSTREGKPVCFTAAHWALPPVVDGAKAAYPAPLATLSLMPDGHVEVRGHAWAHEGLPAGRYRKLCGGGRMGPLPRKETPGFERRVHSCALSDSGQIACWGHAPVAPRGTFIDMVCGNDFVCGLSEERRTICSNREGKSEESWEGETWNNLATDGAVVVGATQQVDEATDGVGYVFKDIFRSEHRPKGILEAVWAGAGAECAKLPEGQNVVCWGLIDAALQAPSDVLQNWKSPPQKPKKK